MTHKEELEKKYNKLTTNNQETIKVEVEFTIEKEWSSGDTGLVYIGHNADSICDKLQEKISSSFNKEIQKFISEVEEYRNSGREWNFW